MDHALLVGERHLRRILAEYVSYFNETRPHQGIGQDTPARVAATTTQQPSDVKTGVIAVPVLGGLHHDYRWAA